MSRRGVAENKELEDLFIQPFSLPSVPQRFYFQFRAPITTSPTDLEDRSTCDTIYRKVRASASCLVLSSVTCITYGDKPGDSMLRVHAPWQLMCEGDGNQATGA